LVGIKLSGTSLDGDEEGSATIYTVVMSRLRKLIPLTTLCTALVLCHATLFSAPAYADDAMASIKAKVRNEFPNVQQLDVDDYASEAGEILLDVRETGEFEVSHLKGAQLATDLEQALSVLGNMPKDTPIVTYCSVGWRSSALARQLAERGFTRVRNLEGSIFEWANRGKPVYRADAQVKDVHPFNWRWGRLLDPALATKKPR